MCMTNIRNMYDWVGDCAILNGVLHWCKPRINEEVK